MFTSPNLVCIETIERVSLLGSERQLAPGCQPPEPVRCLFIRDLPTKTRTAKKKTQRHQPNMCDWEEFIFGCSCSYTKRKNYCHFARNDPNHQCFGVQVLKKVWDVPEACDKCSTSGSGSSSRATMQTPTNGWGHEYVAQEQSEYQPPSPFASLIPLDGNFSSGYDLAGEADFCLVFTGQHRRR